MRNLNTLRLGLICLSIGRHCADVCEKHKTRIGQIITHTESSCTWTCRMHACPVAMQTEHACRHAESCTHVDAIQEKAEYNHIKRSNVPTVMRMRFSRNRLCPGHFKPSARHALQEVGGSRSWVRILTSDIGFV